MSSEAKESVDGIESKQAETKTEESKTEDESKQSSNEPAGEVVASDEADLLGASETIKQFPKEQVETIRKLVRSAFDMFDKDRKEAVGQSEVSTILRYLGQYPSEVDVVKRIIPEMLGREISPKLSAIEAHKIAAAAAASAEDDLDGGFGESSDFNKLLAQDAQNEEINPELPISYAYFETKATEYILTDAYAPDDEDVLMSAFKAMDSERKGYVDEDLLRQAMSKMGSPFGEKALDSFVSALRDPETGRLYYAEYVTSFHGGLKDHKKKLAQ